MQNINSYVELDRFFDQNNSITELNVLEEKVRAFFKTLKNVKYTVCQIESDLDINNPEAKYLVCAVGFNDGDSKDYCFKVINNNTVQRVF